VPPRGRAGPLCSLTGITKMGITGLTCAVAGWLLTMLDLPVMVTYIPAIFALAAASTRDAVTLTAAWNPLARDDPRRLGCRD